MKMMVLPLVCIMFVASAGAQALPQGYVRFSNGPDNRWNGAHHVETADVGGGKVRTWLALPGGESGGGKEVTAILTEIDCVNKTYQFFRLNEIGENDTVRTLMTEPSDVNPTPSGSIVDLLRTVICPTLTGTEKSAK